MFFTLLSLPPGTQSRKIMEFAVQQTWVQIPAQWFKFCTLKNETSPPWDLVSPPGDGNNPASPTNLMENGPEKTITQGKAVPWQSPGHRVGLSTEAVPKHLPTIDLLVSPPPTYLVTKLWGYFLLSVFPLALDPAAAACVQTLPSLIGIALCLHP